MLVRTVARVLLVIFRSLYVFTLVRGVFYLKLGWYRVEAGLACFLLVKSGFESLSTMVDRGTTVSDYCGMSERSDYILIPTLV